MKRKWFVIDSEGNVSWSAKTDAAESFKTYAAAEKRARELADSSPGGEVHICQTAAIVTAPVGKVKIAKAP